MLTGLIPTILQLVDRKDMKVPKAMLKAAEGRTSMRRQIISYFDIVLSKWHFALS